MQITTVNEENNLHHVVDIIAQAIVDEVLQLIGSTLFVKGMF